MTVAFRTRQAAHALPVVGGLIALLVSAATEAAVAQETQADALAGEIICGEVSSATSPDVPPVAPSDITASGPVRLSVLDVLAKLAALVLAVYGIAWGIKALQSRGLPFTLRGPGAETERLRDCARLPLNRGATLHVISVDDRAVLLSTNASGDVALLLDLNSTPPLETGPETPEPSGHRDLFGATQTESRLAADLRQDSDWETRRDTLIRALAQQDG